MCKVDQWKMAIQEYHFKIYHLKGKLNVVTDSLSQSPCLQPQPLQISSTTKASYTERTIEPVAGHCLLFHPSCVEIY